LQQMQAELMGTHLGGYLVTPYSFLGMTMRSQYQVGHLLSDARSGVIQCGAHKYAMIMPYGKTRAWYLLEFGQRQQMVGEFMKVLQGFPHVPLNSMFSFGLDDQEFVLAFESDNPANFVDLMMRLRETENSMYVQRDTPVFTCVRCSSNEMLERLG